MVPVLPPARATGLREAGAGAGAAQSPACGAWRAAQCARPSLQRQPCSNSGLSGGTGLANRQAPSRRRPGPGSAPSPKAPKAAAPRTRMEGLQLQSLLSKLQTMASVGLSRAAAAGASVGTTAGAATVAARGLRTLAAAAAGGGTSVAVTSQYQQHQLQRQQRQHASAAALSSLHPLAQQPLLPPPQQAVQQAASQRQVSTAAAAAGAAARHLSSSAAAARQFAGSAHPTRWHAVQGLSEGAARTQPECCLPYAAGRHATCAVDPVPAFKLEHLSTKTTAFLPPPAARRRCSSCRSAALRQQQPHRPSRQLRRRMRSGWVRLWSLSATRLT